MIGKYTWFFLFFIFLKQQAAFGQLVPDNTSALKSDTIVGQSTDTSIVYIIKRPPVVRKETIEVQIQRQKQKKEFYLSSFVVVSWYSEKRKVQNGYTNYVELLSKSLKPQMSYMFGWRLRQSPKKIVTEFAASLVRVNQLFTYYDQDMVEYKITNKFNYSNFTLGLGYWYKKGNKWSAMYVSGIMLRKYVSAVGYTYDKTNNIESARLNRVVDYVNYPISFTGDLTVLLNYKHSLVEFGPYVVLSPFSLTGKSEAYSTTRFFYGLSIGLTTKLFN